MERKTSNIQIRKYIAGERVQIDFKDNVIGIFVPLSDVIDVSAIVREVAPVTLEELYRSVTPVDFTHIKL